MAQREDKERQCDNKLAVALIWKPAKSCIQSQAGNDEKRLILFRVQTESIGKVAAMVIAHVEHCKTSIRGCNKLLLCITVKLVHKIMRVFYSQCFAFQYACDTLCVAGGGMFCHM